MYKFLASTFLLGMVGAVGHAQYCTTFAYDDILDCEEDDGVVEFYLAGEESTEISYVSHDCNPDAYWDLTNMSVILSQGGTYTVEAMAGYDENLLSIWIDFNDDEIFSPSEKLVFEEDIDDLSLQSFPMTIPASAPVGPHRMRVMAGWYPYYYLDMDPCNWDDFWEENQLYYGRVQDFSVYITDVPMPVTMSALSASRSGRNVSLKWSTQQEVQNTGFEVQRSYDAKHYEKIGFVASAFANGNGREERAYRFEDQPGATAFYRLLQIDMDGKSKFTNVVQVEAPHEQGDKSIYVYPNPADGYINVKAAIGKSNPEGVLEIYDAFGRLVRKQSLKADASIVIADWAAGAYYVRYVSGATVETLNFIKR